MLLRPSKGLKLHIWVDEIFGMPLTGLLVRGTSEDPNCLLKCGVNLDVTVALGVSAPLPRSNSHAKAGHCTHAVRPHRQLLSRLALNSANNQSNR